MNRKIALSIAAGLSAAVAIVAAGCGGNNEPTAQAFATQAEKVDQQHEAIARPLWDELDAAMSPLSPVDKVPTAARETISKLNQQEEDFAAAIEKMKAPKSAKAVQTEAVAALRDEAAFGRQTLAGVTDITTVGDVTAVFEGDEGQRVQGRRHSACLGMQKYVDDAGAKVDMSC